MRLAHPIPVLLYHRITPEGGRGATARGVFNEHLSILARNGWSSLRLKEFASILSGDRPAPRRHFLISFDDGNEDLPIAAEDLASHGFSGVAFLITGWLDGRPGHINHITASELRREGVLEFASHTHEHRNFLLEQSSVETVLGDLLASREVLRELNDGEDPSHLAWPWGRSSPTMMAAATTAGFDFQHSVANLPVLDGGAHQLMPRICSESWSPRFFSTSILALSNKPISHAWRMIRQIAKKSTL